MEEKSEKLEKKKYGKPVIDFLKDFSIMLCPNTEYEIDVVKNKFSEYVLNISGIELLHSTRNAHISLTIVNEKNRGHYNVKRPDDERKNIFYYSDDSRKKIILFNPDINTKIDVFYKGEDEIESVKAKEVTCAGIGYS